MKFWIIVFIAISITGCSTSSYKSGANQVFQLIEIHGESYFLDNRSGVIYRIQKHLDGKFDINEAVGIVGRDRNAI